MSQIVCPHCQEAIDIDQALEHQFRASLEQQLKRELWEKAQAEAQKKISVDQQHILSKLEAQLKAEQEKSSLDKQQAVAKLEEQLQAEQRKAAIEKQQLEEAKQRATKAEAKELELLKKEREMTIKQQQWEIEQERKLNERLVEEQEKQGKLIADKFELKELEYQKQIADLKRLSEEATRKAGTVSQQLQGEVLELKVEKELRAAFPIDQILEVKKGKNGADIVHSVRNSIGKEVGKILWEVKRVEKFDKNWLPKLREDTRELGGAIPIIVSNVLPPDITVCAERDRVWICGVDFFLPLASLVRQQLLAVSLERQVANGRDIKMEMLYQYVNSSKFQNRVESIVESYQELIIDLEKEKSAIAKSWKKRETQLRRMALSTAYMYGEIQGVVGSSLPEIAGLELGEGTDSEPNTGQQPLLTDPDA